MADGRDPAPGTTDRTPYPWTEIFRSFQVALDPRKLLVAAAGVLAMSLGWWLLSLTFHYKAPDRNDAAYSNAVVAPMVENGDEAAIKAKGDELFQADLAQWKVMDDLAGEGGQLRTLPWYEYRGPNPFLLATETVGGGSANVSASLRRFAEGTVPVLIEPLRKFLLPIAKLITPGTNLTTRIYLLLCLLWSIVVWAFFGGVITRLAAVQIAGKDRITLKQAVRFVAVRYQSYVLSPLMPLGVIAVIVLAMALYGLVALIPILGDVVLYGLGLPLVLVGGVAIAVLLIGLVGYPLMYTTLSVEGSDTFDALSRSYNYVFQGPWQYLWYGLVAVVYGAAVTFFVILVGSMMVFLGKWAVSQAPFSERSGRSPEYLFVYAPESFGWKELLLKGSPIEKKEVFEPAAGSGDRVKVRYDDRYPEKAKKYMESYRFWDYAGAGMVTFWMALAFMLMIGFSYSYFWSASTMIYLLMRKHIDETDLDEVIGEEELPDLPLPPTPAPVPPANPGATSLPTVPVPPPAPPPAAVSPAVLPPVAPPPPPPPVVVSPPVVVEKPAVTTDEPADEKE